MSGWAKLIARIRKRSSPVAAIPPNEVLAKLSRKEMTDVYTLGVLSVGDDSFWILERPWKGNKPNVSCIPSGRYAATFMARSSSGKYKRVYWVRQVQGRSGILIHNGNLVRHSLGCLIVGNRPGWMQGKRAVFNSRSALKRLDNLLAGRKMRLTITNEVA